MPQEVVKPGNIIADYMVNQGYREVHTIGSDVTTPLWLNMTSVVNPTRMEVTQAQLPSGWYLQRQTA